ncbi:MAG: hypothetical protein IPP73_18610 [Chitinophagaceae bacterium]|nr:hypothetical protein [Chitinophagaceae bacterium]
MRILFAILSYFMLSCNNRKAAQKPKPIFYKNIAVVTPDSCVKWHLPLTSFSIEYPSAYQAFYSGKDNYLNLKRYNGSGETEQEFSFGKAGGVDSSMVEKSVYYIDSFYRNLRAYQTKSIGYQNIGNKTLFTASGLMDFDLLTQKIYKGKYRMLTIVYPSVKPLNGIVIIILTKSSLDSISYSHEMANILSTLKISKQ